VTAAGAPTHNERVLALLADGRWHSHHELYDLHVVAHSRVSDLRKRGHMIEMRRDGDLYLYRWCGMPLPPAEKLNPEILASTVGEAGSALARRLGEASSAGGSGAQLTLGEAA
jgi:hypothetical protein